MSTLWTSTSLRRERKRRWPCGALIHNVRGTPTPSRGLTVDQRTYDYSADDRSLTKAAK